MSLAERLPQLAERLHAEISPERLRDHLNWFATVRRDTGGTGEDAAATYITDRLREAGVKVVVHEFDTFLSYPREATLEVRGDGGFTPACLTHSFTVSTGPEGLQGEIRYLPDADFSGSEGKIVLVDGLCTPITVLEASRAGVAAVVFANQGDVVHNMIATTIWGTPAADQLDRLPTVAAVSIAKPDADRLKALLAERPVEVRLQTRVETGWYPSKLPEAIIEGTDLADDFVLVGAHYCSWEIGITDNATGDACLLELARSLQLHRGELRRSVRLCWWPGHSHGRYGGSTWYADTFFHQLADHCVAYHNVDSPGVRGAVQYVARHTTAEVQGFCTDVIERMTGQGDPPIHRPSRAADQSFLANGVPSFSTYPFLPEGHPDRKAWTGGCANAWWWHSSADTLDKADIDILTQDTRISATALTELSQADLLPIDPTAAAAEILDYAEEFVQGAGRHLAATVLLEAAQELDGEAKAFLARARAASSGAALAQANHTLMALSRVLLPATYSKGGRYTHDPAEWSPIMRNTKSSLFPGLNPGLALDELEGSHEYGFVRTGVLRQLNRTVDALRQAAALCRGTLAA